MYVAAEWVGRLGWILDLFTAIVGVVLLYILTRAEQPEFVIFDQLSSFSPADLAIILLIASLLSAFYGPKLRSRDYYNAGQELQELHDELTDFVDLDIVDPDLSSQELRDKYKSLNNNRHDLNQSTPQLGGYWYRLMNMGESYERIVPWKNFSEWEEPSFDDKVKQKKPE
jgi:hypothetical protein